MNTYKLWDEWTTSEPYLVEVDDDLEYIEDMRRSCINSAAEDVEEYRFMQEVLYWLETYTMCDLTYGIPFEDRADEILEEIGSKFIIEIVGEE